MFFLLSTPRQPQLRAGGRLRAASTAESPHSRGTVRSFPRGNVPLASAALPSGIASRGRPCPSVRRRRWRLGTDSSLAGTSKMGQASCSIRVAPPRQEVREGATGVPLRSPSGVQMPRDVANLTLIPPGENRAFNSMGSTSSPSAERTRTCDVAVDLGAGRADPNLVTEVLQEVGRVHAEAAVALYRRIAEIILDRFFGGDLDAMQARARSHVSLKAMMQDPRLQIPASQLWYAVALLPQLRELGPLASQLPMSHHRLLIHVHNAEVKRELAEKAVAEGMSKRALESAVRRWKGEPPSPTSRAASTGPVVEVITGSTVTHVCPPLPETELATAGTSGTEDDAEALLLLHSVVRAAATLRTPGMCERIRHLAGCRNQLAALREALGRLHDLMDTIESKPTQS